MPIKQLLYNLFDQIPNNALKYKALCWYHNAKFDNFHITYNNTFITQFSNTYFQSHNDPYYDINPPIRGYLKYYIPQKNDI